MIPVLLLLLIAAGLVAAFPYWAIRPHIRDLTWRVRDEIFDDLVSSGTEDPLLWGLVERCDLMLRYSGKFSPISMILAAKTPPPGPTPRSTAFPDAEQLASLNRDDRTYHDRRTKELHRLLVDQVLFTSWHAIILSSLGGLLIGIVQLITRFLGEGRNNGPDDIRDRVGSRPERVLSGFA